MGRPPPSQPFNLNNVVDNKVVWGTLEFIPIGDTKYSDEETAVGYWTDGSVLYRKVFQITNITNDNYNRHVVNNTGIDKNKVKKLYGVVYTDSGRTCTPISVFNQVNSASVGVYLSDNDNLGNSSLYIAFGSQYVGTTSKIIVIVEYIK